MKTVIYSKENSVSVKKVKDWKPRHPKFTFLELGETEAIKAAKDDPKTIIVELDKPKKVIKPTNGAVPKKLKAEKKPVAPKAEKEPKAKKTKAVKKPKDKKKK